MDVDNSHTYCGVAERGLEWKTKSWILDLVLGNLNNSCPCFRLSFFKL